MPFTQALWAYEQGYGDGIGFVFGSGDPYLGIDLDDCRDPETGDVEEWAQEIIDSLEKKYVEVSPSGTGVHIIVEGKMVQGRSRWIDVEVAGETVKRKVEMYSQERYFAITGVAP